MDSALLIIDVQLGIDELMTSDRNNPGAELCIAALLKRWRADGRQVIHVKHNSTEASSPLRPECLGNQFKPEAMPVGDEPVFEKQVNSAFIGTDLQQYLIDRNLKNLVIAGFTTDHCVSTSTRMAGNLGYRVTLVSDATAAYERMGVDGRLYSADEVHQVNLACLNGEFCSVLATDQVLEAQD